MDNLIEQYQSIENRIHLLSKQMIGKTPYQALRIDNEMDKIKEERYNLNIEIKKQYPIINSILIEYSSLNLLELMNIINVSKKELTYNAKDILKTQYPDIYYPFISEIVDKLYYSQF